MHTIYRFLIGILVIAVIGASGYLAFKYWPQKQIVSTDLGIWTCSMHPQIRNPGPGQCPICGMDLIPVEKFAKSQTQWIDQIGLQTARVTYRELSHEIRTVGKLDFAERQVAYISSRISGRVDRVYADFTGVPVEKKTHLVDIYSPDLIVTFQNLIDARKSNNEFLARSSQDRLIRWGIETDQIERLVKAEKPLDYLTIHAPISGTVIEKSVREGQYVKEGDPLYRIANLDPIWLYLDIYESDLHLIRFGQKVQVQLESYPNELFEGTVVFIDPFFDDRTRTIKARVNLRNKDFRLKPAMYATASIQVRLQSDGSPTPTGVEGKFICSMHPDVIREQMGKCPYCEMALIQVPKSNIPSKDSEEHHHPSKDPSPSTAKTSAKKSSGILATPVSSVLDTGRRKVVYRKTKEGSFELVEIHTGIRAEGKDDRGQLADYYPILHGLKEGDEVVVRAGFLLDSQRQIEGMPSLLDPNGQSNVNPHAVHEGILPKPPVMSEHKH